MSAVGGGSDAEAKRKLICDKLEEYLKKVLKEDNENVESDIEDLRAILIASDSSQIQTVADRIELEYVFRRFIQLPGMSESLESCITMFIGALKPADLVLKYHKLIVDEALNQRVSTQASIQIWMTKVIASALNTVPAVDAIADKMSMTHLIERCIELLLSPITKNATLASEVLLKYSQNHHHQLFSDQLLSVITDVQNHADNKDGRFEFTKADNDTVRVRFFQLFADIASISEEHLRVLSQTNGTAFVKNFDMKFMNDPLIGMNLLKILTGTLHCEYARKQIQSSGIVQAFIDKILTTNHDDPLDMLLLPSLFHFIIQFGVEDCKFLANNSKVLMLMFEFLESSNTNEATIVMALESIGFLSHYPASKILLNSYDVHFLAPITMLIDDSREAVQLCALSTLNDLFFTDSNWNNDNGTIGASSIAQAWFEQLNTDDYLIKKLTKFVHEPFQHVRLSSMKCIQTLVHYQFGQKALCDYKKFREWLLNRKTESNSRGREEKWKIIEIITGSKFVRQNFEGKEYLALRDYLKSGPVEPQVQTEDSAQ